ncbi:MAG TPA: rod shape-determining protein MreD [Streptosporangiaceae bacterium]
MRRAAFTAIAVLATVVLQTSVLDRLPFPGGFPPDLVLVLVVTLALAGGPLAGTVIGFAAGLALDIAPPATGLLGLDALVFCAVGYGCGLLRGPMERSAWLPLPVIAAAATVGEVLAALAGLTLGDPDISWQSMRQVLPPVILYDILACPFVLYAVVRFSGYGGWATVGTGEPSLLTGSELAGLRLLGAPAGFAGLAAAGASVRDTRSGREPRLRMAAGRGSDGWIGGRRPAPGQPAGAWVQRRHPLHLRLRGGVAGSAAGGGVRATPAAVPGRPVHLRLGSARRGDGKVAGSPGRGQIGLAGFAGLGRAARPGKNAFRGSPGHGQASTAGSGLAAPRPGQGHRPGSRAFRGGPSALASTGRASRPVRLRLKTRRRDGVLAGGVLGRRTRGTNGGKGGGVPGSAFHAGRGAGAPGASGALRSGRGRGAAPRFRSGRRLFGFGGGGLPGGRRGSQRGSALAPRQPRFGRKSRGGAGGLGGKSRLGGSRLGGGLRIRGRRPARWAADRERTGGQP